MAIEDFPIPHGVNPQYSCGMQCLGNSNHGSNLFTRLPPDFNAKCDSESNVWFNSRLMHTIEQMMFVSGETGEPSVEATTLIEEIVRKQVHQMVSHFVECSNRLDSNCQ
jgi:transcription initiation protein SPT3